MSTDAEQVLAELAAYRADDLPTHGGSTTAYVFDPGLDGLDDLTARAHELLAHVNGLDPTQFPSVARIENDLVGTALRLLHAPAGAVGTVTSGGTESCLLAVLGARERWRSVHPDGGRAQVVVPSTVHAAFFKAAHLFDVELVVVPVDVGTLRADATATAEAVGPRTALVVTSAPSYAYGVVDPVSEIAAAAAALGVACHVDACIGGWVLPFLDDVPPWDLAVPGVTSVSVDLHKYGYAPKGVSLLLHGDADLRRAHWFTLAGWAGYPLVNPTLASTRAVGPMAAAWSALRLIGPDGYARLARTAHDAAARLAAGVGALDGIEVVGAVDSTLVAFVDRGGHDDPDVRVVVDEMASRGWFLQVQPPHGPVPTSAHVTVSAVLAPRVDDLLDDLASSVEAARAHGRVAADPGLLAAAGAVDAASLDSATAAALLQAAGIEPGAALPQRMAPVHALVEALPAPVAARLLAEVLSLGSQPAGVPGWGAGALLPEWQGRAGWRRLREQDTMVGSPRKVDP